MPTFLSPFQLGNGPAVLPTVGSQNAYQAAPVDQMDPQAQYAAAQRQQQLAQALQSAGYTPNSGGLGALAMIAQAFAGKKIAARADEKMSDALKRQMASDSAAKAAEAEAKDPLTQRTRYLQTVGMDPNSDEGRQYLLTGNLPTRREASPMNVAPGGAVVDPNTGKVIYQAQFKPDAPKEDNWQLQQMPTKDGGTLPVYFNPRTRQTVGMDGKPLAQTVGAATMDNVPDFNSLPEPERVKAAQYAAAGQDFHVQDGKVVGGLSSGVSLGKPAAPSRSSVQQEKFKQQNQIRIAQLDTADAMIKRAEDAMASIGNNKVLDGGPMDGPLLSLTHQGQEADASTAGLMDVVTALTRIPGVGSQSDFEAKLKQLTMPSRNVDPQTNKNTIAQLKAYMKALRGAYANAAGDPSINNSILDAAPAGQPAAPGSSPNGWSIQVLQ